MSRSSRAGSLTGKHTAGRVAAVAAGLAAAAASAGPLSVIEVGKIRHAALGVFEHDSAVVLDGRVGVGSATCLKVVAGRATALTSSRGHRMVSVVMHSSGHLVV